MVSSKKVLKITVLVIEWFLISSVLGIFVGIQNINDRVENTIVNEHLSDKVVVYRDKLDMPTIVGKTISDVLFVQAYEYARDRLFQLEFTRAVANGELSKLIGDDLINADIYLRTIGIKRSAEKVIANLNPQIKSYMQSYIDGLNTYIDDHPDNLPIEFLLLGAKPQKWDLADIIAVQGVMSFDLAFRGFQQELDRLKFYQTAGMDLMLEILDIQNPSVRNYLSNYNESVETLSTNFVNPAYKIIKESGLEFGTGSNNWVVSGSKTKSGKPLLANDPHLGLSTPGIWWKVHLIATEDNFNVDGFSLPGIPFVIIGHNQKVAWGVTNTGLDAVDLFYFKKNSTHYLVGNKWKRIEVIPQDIPLKSGGVKHYDVLNTDFGTILDADGTDYAVRWTLSEGYTRDNIVASVFGLNTAESIYDVHDALETWVVPGQNFVIADVDGNIGYQFTGGAPIRKSGFGILPHNASTGSFDWLGLEPYANQLWIPNPSKGWFSTNNERVDNRNLYYIQEAYAPNYRSRSIHRLLENATDLTVEDMQKFQFDNYNMVYEDYLLPVLKDILNADYSEFDPAFISDALTAIGEFDGHMSRDSIGATIFAFYNLFFVDQTIRDEIGKANADNMNYYAHEKIGEFIKTDPTNHWFDNVNTSVVETASDIGIAAFKITLLYLKGIIGNDVSKWKWGSIHQVTFEHKLHAGLPQLSVGPKPSDGSNFVLNNGGSPDWDGGIPAAAQNFGPSMRFTVEVEPTWSNVYGVVPVGESGNIFSSHYSDQFNAWLEGTYFKWEYSAQFAKDHSEWTMVYTGGN